METRSKILVPIFFLILLLFSNTSFASKLKKDDFILKILPSVERARYSVGGIAEDIPVSLILAQLIHESDSGRSLFFKYKKNPLGLKTVKVIQKTKSSKRKVKMVYKSFKNIDESIKYYLINYVTNNHYEEFRAHLGFDTKTLMKYLGNYAEDPKYAEKLERIINDNHLFVYDS